MWAHLTAKRGGGAGSSCPSGGPAAVTRQGPPRGTPSHPCYQGCFVGCRNTTTAVALHTHYPTAPGQGSRPHSPGFPVTGSPTQRPPTEERAPLGPLRSLAGLLSRRLGAEVPGATRPQALAPSAAAQLPTGPKGAPPAGLPSPGPPPAGEEPAASGGGLAPEKRGSTLPPEPGLLRGLSSCGLCPRLEPVWNTRSRRPQRRRPSYGDLASNGARARLRPGQQAGRAKAPYVSQTLHTPRERPVLPREVSAASVQVARGATS